ncbi:MAG: DinB family protein [Rhodothermales bacterium]|nr:DinB family protein [Rhodothermales bacterium]MBO6779232.1 DinB family protein [Rhodothermales bacterium]
MPDPRLSDLKRWLDPPKGGLWHGGPSVFGATRGVHAAQAAWRPAPGRHSIWELVLHLAYWKYAVRNRILQGPRGRFPRKPADWPAQPEIVEDGAWKADVALLKSEHTALLGVVEEFDAGRLDDVWGGAEHWTFMDLLSGVVLHDTYHVGQIQLIKRLYRDHG